MGGTRVPPWITAGLAVAGCIALVWYERRRPLRASVEPKTRRDLRNLTIAAIAGVVVQVAEIPVTYPLSTLVSDSGWGLTGLLGISPWLAVPLGVLWLDYTLYLWHILTHQMPFLWRFHLVHHADLDLSATTALRFHAGELAASVPWRAAQIVLFGVSPLSLSIWQTLLPLSILFHHSNAELPVLAERSLSLLIVTPRMHGIHHSIVRGEIDSNWSSGLSIWDRLHGTLRLNIPQHEITIGVPALRRPEQVTLVKMLKAPFQRALPDWRLPDGSEPVRAATAARRTMLEA
jgi:sterol desaturase/sphingolipid hydroxylase (fatty acid hydroxylase superfamily)